MQHLCCNALVRVLYSGVSGQCSHTTPALGYWCVLLTTKRNTCKI